MAIHFGDAKFERIQEVERAYLAPAKEMHDLGCGFPDEINHLRNAVKAGSEVNGRHPKSDCRNSKG
jgi:hypothetical protein